MATEQGIRVQYIRTSMLLLHMDGLCVLTDPWFAMHMRGLPVFVKPCCEPDGLCRLDVVLVSHLHPDHFDPKALSKLSCECPLLVGPPGIKKKAGGLPFAEVIEIADGDRIERDGFSICAFSVEHSGYENAYLVERNGMSLLFAGDAKYSDVFSRIGKEHQPLVALLPVGGTQVFGRRIVMGPEDALKAGNDLGAKVVVPIHHGGEWMSVPPLSRHPGRASHLSWLAESSNAPFTVAALEPGEQTWIDAAGKTYTIEETNEGESD
jgi:L-ascorbate metabolism protein UlaG (beta-lactamase superfamily)